MDRRARLAAASRDGHLALRRVERQQAIVERLHAGRGLPVRLGLLAEELDVSTRTVARDVERLRTNGVPLEVRRGRSGGVRLAPVRSPVRVELDVAEVAAVLASLAAVGPNASLSAASVLRKLADAVRPTSDAPTRPRSRT
ncbi:HTH domain-containing protein [Cellulomonas cellasea]|uniref:Putative DNA-binding transcriptional regulator YafY n=1 Tax=Cellulomonas cellasea TaxID=43670 RepID=A0A7W4YAH1_9CELL|nr:HTH domain-containing protein [Cellulomonas cellasea]MBB2922059.1 putative DNA-binding transcriptional regulator YafY [Cellulomonas cellasea]